MIAAAQARQAVRMAELAAVTLHPKATAVFGSPDLADRAITFEVAAARGMAERTVAREMSLALQLCEDLPEVHAALEAGEISMTHAQVIARETTGLDPEDATQLALVALRDLQGQAPGRYGSRIRKLRERRRPEQAAERHRLALEDRTVWVDPDRDGMAWLHALLSAEDGTARHLVSGAHQIRGLVTDPGTGAPIRLGRKRTVTEAMRDFLRARDGRCMAPCCNRSTRGADMDHLEDWARGELTVPENLATECRRHHTLKTAGVIHPTHPPGTPSGTLRWQTKLGRVYLEEPPPPF